MFGSAGLAFDNVSGDASDAGAGLDYRLLAAGADIGQSDEVAAMLARLAQDRQVLATHSFAYALLAERADIRAEPMGELRGPRGPFPFYALYREPDGFTSCAVP